MKFHIDIIDKNVEIPSSLDVDYDNLEAAVEALECFVHSFDGTKRVDGRVCDENSEDVEYVSSVF